MFIGNLDGSRNATKFFIIEEEKKHQIEFFKCNHESIVNLFCFNIISV